MHHAGIRRFLCKSAAPSRRTDLGGGQAKVVILSVTEGEDKPLKYPDMFAAARLMILNKMDLLPHLSLDVERCKAWARRVNPGIDILELSATTGQGMDAWLDWLLAPGHQHATETQQTQLRPVPTSP